MAGHCRPAVCYALLTKALDLSQQAGGVDGCWRAIDALDRYFDVDDVALRRDSLRAVAETARGATANLALAEKSVAMAQRACDADDYNLAEEFAGLAYKISLGGKQVELRRRALDLQRQAREFKENYAALQMARDSLQADPDEPQANAALGRWLCFRKQNWPAGLRHLARGPADALAKLAQCDLNCGQASSGAEAEALALANGWWDLAKTQADPAVRSAMLQRAGMWYARTLPRLKDLARVKPRKRLEEIGDLGPLAFEAFADHPLPAPRPGAASESPHGILAMGDVDCSVRPFAVGLGGGFDLSKTWTLSLEFNPREIAAEGAAYLVYWGDDRFGKSPLSITVANGKLAARVSDTLSVDKSVSLTYELSREYAGRWTSLLLRFEAEKHTLSLSVNRDAPRAVDCPFTPSADRAMPVTLGGAGASQRFNGRLRRVFLSNLAAGLLINEFAQRASQTADLNSPGADPAEFGPPVAAPRVADSSVWKHAKEHNAVASGYLQIDVPGEYQFNTTSGHDRCSLEINGKLVCPFGDGQRTTGRVALPAGLIPLRSVGYCFFDTVEINWSPPGGQRLTPIPGQRLYHDSSARTPSAKLRLQE